MSHDLTADETLAIRAMRAWKISNGFCEITNIDLTKREIRYIDLEDGVECAITYRAGPARSVLFGGEDDSVQAFYFEI